MAGSRHEKTNVRPRNSSASHCDCEPSPSNFVVVCRHFDTRLGHFTCPGCYQKRLHITRKTPSFSHVDRLRQTPNEPNAHPKRRVFFLPAVLNRLRWAPSIPAPTFLTATVPPSPNETQWPLNLPPNQPTLWRRNKRKLTRGKRATIMTSRYCVILPPNLAPVDLFLLTSGTVG